MYICCCIWQNNWCSTYSVNWQLMRMIFIWSGFLRLVPLDKSNFCQVNSDKARWCLKVYLKFVPLSFLIACSFTENLGKLDIYWSIKKMYCNKYRKSSSQQLSFDFSLFTFYFLSALQYIDCYYNKYPMKQTTSLYLNLSLTPAFLVCFCHFWNDKSELMLNLFISEYLDQIPPWEKMKEAFFSTLHIGNLCFLMISNFNSCCPNKEYNAIFKHIHQNIRTYCRKKICIDHWLGKYCILERNRTKRDVGKRVWFVLNAFVWGSHNPRKILQFLPLF